VSAPDQDRPSQPDPGGPAGSEDARGADELDLILADPSRAGRLGQILAAAAAPAEAVCPKGEDAARSAFRAAFPVSPARPSRVLPRMSGRVAAAALAGALVLSGGVAAAAAGALPGQAQETAKRLLSVVGVSVPGPNEHASVHPSRTGTRTQAPATTAADDEASGPGSEVSGLARSTASTGVDKGAAVSGAASDGKSQAGQHGKPVGASTGKPPVKTGKPHAHKRHNGSHKPKTHGAPQTTEPKTAPHKPHPTHPPHPPHPKGERP
jgi:hypothetical protein